MSTTSYEEIVGRLDELEPAQMATLIEEIQARMAAPKRYRLEDFMTPRPGVQGTGEDWVGKLRAEWDDRP